MQLSAPERRPTRPPLTPAAATWKRSNAARLLVVLAAVTLIAVLSAASSGTASASSQPVVANVHGVELIAHHTQGTFSGYTTGGLEAGWLAIVDHTPLDPNARITGGTFTLATSLKQLDHPPTAQISSGTITMTNPGANCSNQTFKVTGNLTHLTGYPTATFALTLTHYRHSILGTCITYFATTKGTLTLTR